MSARERKTPKGWEPVFLWSVIELSRNLSLAVRSEDSVLWLNLLYEGVLLCRRDRCARSHLHRGQHSIHGFHSADGPALLQQTLFY